MSNGVRHVLGLVAGLLLPPLIAAGLVYGVTDLSFSLQRFVMSWTGIGVIVVSAVALAFLAASRLSPIASLLGGLMFVLIGLLPLAELAGPRLLPQEMLGSFGMGYRSLAYQGIWPLIGVMLLTASAFPSRWRGRAAAVPAWPSYAPPGRPGPYGPPAPSWGTPGDQGFARPSSPDDHDVARPASADDQGSARRPPGDLFSPDQKDTTRPMRRE